MKHGKHITLDDLPPKYRQQAERQLSIGEFTDRAAERAANGMAQHLLKPEVMWGKEATAKESLQVRKDRKPKRPHRQPNKTEARFNMEMLGNKGEYEAVSFRTPAGRYTPDFCVWDDEGRLTCYEVKGGYRMNSQQAARRAFLDTADRFKHVTFKWYKKTKSGWEEWYGQTD